MTKRKTKTSSSEPKLYNVTVKHTNGVRYVVVFAADKDDAKAWALTCVDGIVTKPRVVDVTEAPQNYRLDALQNERDYLVGVLSEIWKQASLQTYTFKEADERLAKIARMSKNALAYVEGSK